MPTTPISPTLEQALAASAQGASDQAVALLHQAIQEEPASGVPHMLLGAEYAAAGQLDLAEQSFANALVLAPGWTIARYQLGLLQFSAGRASVALITWQPLLALGDDSPLPHWVRGFAALASDAFEQARACFEAGFARNSEHPPMSADIRLVLARIDALSAPSPGTPPPSDGSGAEAAEMESAHVLLSNYQQQGPTH
ncbi:hypothetical protein [Paracidovorax anthurii]|uniref:Tetratricopeptide repeat protein n=1 Tax=Paracidovorax anthurii TaxID=78229 RepID=A0A328YRY2_9BURK|nr:hypothetical protein [Paracidovorax anthurii]RAR75893.1 hypothetical protein AX018_10607 [Paracidovorax anthurii]